MSAAPAGVAQVRVDNRLVHGQVLEAWLPALAAQGILVADDETATNLLARAAMALAIPPRVGFQVLSLEGAAALLRPGGPGPAAKNTLLLVREVRDAASLHEMGVPLPRLNVGNVHFRAGRKSISPAVYLDLAELETLERLAAAGTLVELRAVPNEAPISLQAARARFGAG